MLIQDILTLHSTAANAHTESKKSTLELISKLAATHITALESRNVLRSLINREKLGSTAIGHGVALPHARIKSIEKPIGILVTLDKPIDFEAPDNEPVDLIFGLLIPDEDSEQHLHVLATLAKQFSQESYRENLRNATDNTILFDSATATTDAK